ncbi:unnamed protein product [Parnassius mnemosyne]|uniref:FP protein C-terminal domain-containing protein n=1 Tax=Parnassius mnemosyne TaxID=213953 RepID=A0AAV1LJZ9_9NEOP
MNNSQNCAGCKNSITNKDFLQCMQCKGKYDLDCANISPKNFRQMERKKEHWKCPECLSKLPKKGNSNTPVRGTTAILEGGTNLRTDSSTVSHVLKSGNPNVTVRSKVLNPPPLSETSNLVQGVENITINSYADILNDLKIYMKNLLHDEMDRVQKAIGSLTNTIKDQNSRIEQLEARVSILESKSETKPAQTHPIERIVMQLQADIAERDQTLLSNDLEIAGCPETPNENCTHIILTVAKKIGMELDDKDIVSAERVGPLRPAKQDSTTPRPRPIAVRLARRDTRNGLLQAARSRRNLNSDGLELPGSTKLLYLNERLTRFNRQLFQKARSLAREVQFKYVWVREGKIFVRKEQGKPRIRIRNEMDLSKVFNYNDS